MRLLSFLWIHFRKELLWVGVHSARNKCSYFIFCSHSKLIVGFLLQKFNAFLGYCWGSLVLSLFFFGYSRAKTQNSFDTIKEPFVWKSPCWKLKTENWKSCGYVIRVRKRNWLFTFSFRGKKKMPLKRKLKKSFLIFRVIVWWIWNAMS